jgi:hypothetical protein
VAREYVLVVDEEHDVGRANVDRSRRDRSLRSSRGKLALEPVRGQHLEVRDRHRDAVLADPEVLCREVCDGTALGIADVRLDVDHRHLDLVDEARSGGRLRCLPVVGRRHRTDQRRRHVD